jgi:hypothetical protein
MRNKIIKRIFMKKSDGMLDPKETDVKICIEKYELNYRTTQIYADAV